MSSHSPYELAFAAILGSAVEAFSFWKGRVALYAILKALGIGPGDEVLVPGFTCVVVPNAVRFTGAVPIYVDIAPGTYSIDPVLLESAITARTKAIIIQHTFGIPGPIAEVSAIARSHGLFLIEDSAHSLGSIIAGRAPGTWGDAAFFSSQWSKPYSTGLGGIAVTQNQELAKKLSQVQQGFTQPPASARIKLNFQHFIYSKFYSPDNYWMAQGVLRALSKAGLFVGSSSQAELAGEMALDHTWRMAEFQEAAGSRALSNLETLISQRNFVAKYYDLGLEENQWPKATRPAGTVLLRYPVEIGNKEELLEKARQEQVEIGSWFETPLHPTALKEHANFSYKLGQCPQAELAASQIINLPMNQWITSLEAEKVLVFFLKYARHPKS